MPLLDPTFTATNNPAAGSAATATHAAVTGKSHTCQTIHCTLVGNPSNAAAAVGSIILRDGATGVGAVLWASGMGVTSAPGASSAPVEVSGLAISGTPGNSMTLEFTGGLTNCLETVAFTGFMT